MLFRWITVASAALIAGVAFAAPDTETVVLDDFEDTSAWIKGDPTTDMEQREVGYAPSTRFVKQGKQSLAFMVRVDWSEKPGEQYPKGWPMISRVFEQPQDWSRYDRLQLWVYPETEAMLPTPKALRCGIGTPEGKPGEWHNIVLIKNEWNAVRIPLTEERDWTKVTGVWFYVAEGWYQDKDRINFHLDDMRLARLLRPRLLDCAVTARTHRRGQAGEVFVAMEGPAEGTHLCAQVSQDGKTVANWRTAITNKRGSYTVPLADVSAGQHAMQLQVIGPDGEVADEREAPLRVMQPRKRSYLNLITFYTGHLKDATPEKFAVINDTPYAGVAVALVGGYDAGPVPEYASYADQMAMLKQTCRYHIWPWVFSNRIVGRSDEGATHQSVKGPGPEYFRKIKCLDLDDEAGALSDMLKTWRHAVRMAKELGSPGIVIDLEAYNNYRTYGVQYVARERGETMGQVARAAEAIGEALGKIVQEEYPECIVWSLFSHLKPVGLAASDYEGSIYPVPGHMTLGFLRYCKENQVPAKYLCGGEVEVGYYNANVEALKKRIRARDAARAEILGRFPKHFFLAGTISPYHDYKILTDWIQRSAGDDPELKTIEDFGPMFETLFDAYDWVWIYASSAGKTQPYAPKNAQAYGKVLEAALAASESP